MLHLFKEKTKLKNFYYRKGLAKQKEISDSEWTDKYNALKTEANKIINKKDREIKKMSRRVQDIEEKLSEFMVSLADSRVYAIQVEAETIAEMNLIETEHKKILDKTHSIMSLFRVAGKRAEKINKAIEQYKIDSPMQ